MNSAYTDESQNTETESVRSRSTIGLGLAGAFLATLCCVGPLVPILLGVGASSALFGLDRYKPLFIVLGLLVLAGASWWAVRRQNRCCATRSPGRSTRIVATIFGVGIVSYLALQYALLPFLADVSSQTLAAERESTASSDRETVRIAVDGMTCAGCAVGVEHAFLQLDGVIAASVDWRTGEADLAYDPSKIDSKSLLKAKVEPQYSVRLLNGPENSQ